MIKLVYIVKKRADISEKDFHEYWLKKHGPLVRSFAKSMRAKKYVQSHTVSEDAGKQIRNTRPGMKQTYDGITEVWWDTLEDFSGGGAVQERAEAARALLEDESKFIDFEHSSIFLTEEHEIFDYTK
ncbi:MAG: EthD domain-containing protein [Candidatus Binatus sp.]|uniref:EthD domain-containing protein n=1 Tax=Candidatus Binatus sp. TaxID=2811406 RepID=UPI003BAEBEE1